MKSVIRFVVLKQKKKCVNMASETDDLDENIENVSSYEDTTPYLVFIVIE